jgi:hypothetical protein
VLEPASATRPGRRTTPGAPSRLVKDSTAVHPYCNFLAIRQNSCHALAVFLSGGSPFGSRLAQGETYRPSFIPITTIRALRAVVHLVHSLGASGQSAKAAQPEACSPWIRGDLVTRSVAAVMDTIRRPAARMSAACG